MAWGRSMDGLQGSVHGLRGAASYGRLDVMRDAAHYGRLPCSNLWGTLALVCLASGLGARTPLTFTATLNPAGRWTRRSAASSGRPARSFAPRWAPQPRRSSSMWPSTRPGATASPTGSGRTSPASWRPRPRALLHRGPQRLAGAAGGAGISVVRGLPGARSAWRRRRLDPGPVAGRLPRQGA
jgi:hypothetical protein